MMRHFAQLLKAGLVMLLMGACTFTPLTGTPTPEATCETHTASVVLTAAEESVKVGDTVKVTVTLNNMGCVALGLPQYQLQIQPGSILAPNDPEPVVHNLAVAPGQSDTAVFELNAVADGQVTIRASASFEVHLGYPGPAYWGSSSGEPLSITVAP